MAPSLSAEELQQQLEELIYRNSELEEQVEEWKSSSQEKESILESITDEISEFKARLEDEKSELEKRNLYLETRVKELEVLLAGQESSNSSKYLGLGRSGTTPRVSLVNSDISDKDAEILYLRDELRKMQVEQAELIKHDKSNVNVSDPKALVDELMRISLMAESASKLMNLIGRSAQFDVHGLSEAMQNKTDEEKQKELSSLLWNQVNEMHASKKELEANLDQKKEEIEELSQEIKALEDGTVFNEKMVALRIELEEVNKQSKEFEQELEEADTKIEELKVDIAKKDTIVEELNHEKMELVQERNQLEEVKDHLETAQQELEEQLEVIQEDLIELNEKNSSLNDENSALVNEILDPGSEKLSEALAEKLNVKLHEMGTDPGVTIEPGRTLPVGGFANIPKELFDLRKRLDVIGAVPVEDLPMLAKLYKTVNSDSMAQLVDFLGANPEFLQQFFNTIEENENLVPPVEPEDVEKMLQERGTDAEVIDVIMRLSEVLTPAQMGNLLQLQIDLPSEDFENLLELFGRNPEIMGTVLEGRLKNVQSKVSDLIACEKSMEPEVFEQLLKNSLSLDKTKLHALLSASAIDPEAISSILTENTFESKDIEIIADVLTHLSDEQEKANVLSAFKRLELEEVKNLLEICEQFPKSASHMLSSHDFQPENIRAILAMKDTLDQDEMKQVLLLCKNMNEQELVQFLDLRTQNPNLWHDIMADETPDIENVKNIAKLQQSLLPEDLERLLNLKGEMYPEEFQKFLKLAASNPMFMEELMAIGIEPKSVTELLDHYPTKGSNLLNDLSEAAQLIPSKTVDGLTKCITEDPGSMENIVDIADLLGPEAVSKILETFQGKTLEEATEFLNALEAANQSKKRTHIAVVDPADSLKNLENALSENDFENIQNLLNGHPDEVNLILSSTYDVKLLNDVTQKLSALESVLPEDQFKSLLDKASYMKAEQLLNLLTVSESDPNALTNLLSSTNENQESVESLVDFCGNSDLNCMPELLKLMNNLSSNDTDTLSELCSKSPKSMENILSSPFHSEAKKIEEVLKIRQDLTSEKKDYLLDLYSKLPQSELDDVMEMLRNHPNLRDFILRNQLTPEEVCSVADSQKLFSAEEFVDILKLQDQLTDDEFTKVLNLLPYNQNTLSVILGEIKENPGAISDLLELFPSKDSPDLTDLQAALKSLPNSTIESLRKQILNNPESLSLLAKLQDIIGTEQVSSLLQSLINSSGSENNEKVESESNINKLPGLKDFGIRTLDEIHQEKELKRLLLDDLGQKLSSNQQKDLAELLEAHPEFLSSMVEKGADKGNLESMIQKLLSLKQKLPNEQIESIISSGKLLALEEFEEWLNYAEQNPEKMRQLLDPENKSSDMIKTLILQEQITSKPLLNFFEALEVKEIETLAELKNFAPDEFEKFIEKCDKEQPPLAVLKAVTHLPQTEAKEMMEKFISEPLNENNQLEKTAEKLLKLQNILTPEQFRTLLDHGKHLTPEKFLELMDFVEDNPDKRASVLNLDPDVKQQVQQLMNSATSDDTQSLLKPMLNLVAAVEPERIAKLAELQKLSPQGFNEVLRDSQYRKVPKSLLESLSKMRKEEAADFLESYASMSKRDKQLLQEILEDESFISKPENVLQCVKTNDLEAVLEAKKQLSSEDFEKALKVQSRMNKEDSDNFWALAAENPSLVLPVLHDEGGESGQKHALSELFEKYPSHVSPETDKLMKNVKRLPDPVVNLILHSLDCENDMLSTLAKLVELHGDQSASSLLDALYEHSLGCPEISHLPSSQGSKSLKIGICCALLHLGLMKNNESALTAIFGTCEPIESLGRLLTKSENEAISRLVQKHPDILQAVFQSGIDADQLSEVAQNLAPLETKLSDEEMTPLLKLGATIPATEFNELLTYLQNNPDKVEKILDKANSDPASFKKMLSLGFGNKAPGVEEILGVLNSLGTSEMKKLADLAAEDPQSVKKVISSNRDWKGLPQLLLQAASDLPLEQFANLAKLCEEMNPSESIELLDMIDRDPGLKKTFITSSVDVQRAQLFVKAKEVLSDSDFDKLIKQQSSLDSGDVAKLAKLLDKSPEDFQILLQSNTEGEKLKSAIDDVPEVIETSLASISKSLENLDPDKVAQFAKLLEANSSLTEFLIEHVSSVNSDESETGLETIKILVQMVGNMAEEQLENLKNLKNSQGPEVFESLLKLMEKDPEKAKKMLDNKNLVSVASKNLVDLVESLEPLELENLICLAETMKQNEMKEFLDLDKEGESNCQMMLQHENFDPNVVKEVAALSQSLNPDQLGQLLILQKNLSPDDFQQVLALQEARPDDFNTLLQQQVEVQNQAKHASVALLHLKALKDSSPGTILNVFQLSEKLDPETLETLVQLSQETAFPDLIDNFRTLNGSVEVLSNVSRLLGQEGMDNLGLLLRENPEALKILLVNGDLAEEGLLDKLVKLQEESRNGVNMDIIDEDAIIGPTGDKSLSCSVPLDGLGNEPGFLGKLSSLDTILGPDVGNNRRQSVGETLASLKDQLDDEEFEALAKLGREISPKQFDSILKMAEDDPAKLEKLLKTENGKTALESLIQICNGADPVQLDTFEELVEKLNPDQLRQLAALYVEVPGATKALIQSKSNVDLLGEILNSSSDLTPEQTANLLNASQNMDPEEVLDVLQMIEIGPELKAKLLDSPNFDLEKIKALVEAKLILPAKDFKNLVKIQNNMEPNEVKKLTEMLKSNPTTAVDLLRNSNANRLKDALKQLPDGKKVSLARISEVIEQLPQDKLDRFSKYLEKNPSVAEKIIDLPHEKLEYVLSEILKEMRDSPSCSDIFTLKQGLGNSKDKLSTAQLRNLTEMQKCQDLEDFQKFLELLDSMPLSFGQLLQGDTIKDLPLKEFVKLAAALKDDEIENLVKLAKTLEPEQLKNFLSLDNDEDREQSCKQFLQSQNFNPEKIEKFLEIQKSLEPEEKEMLMNLKNEPEFFYFLLDNPEKAESFLHNLDGDVASVQKLAKLCRGDQPISVDKLVDLVSNSSPEDLKEVSEVAEREPENVKLFASKNSTNLLSISQVKVAGGITKTEAGKLADLCSKMDPDEANEFLLILEADPQLKKQLLSSPTFDVEQAKFLTRAKEFLPESEFVKMANLQSTLRSQEISKLNNLLDSQPTFLVNLLQNAESDGIESFREALKQIPDDKETSLSKIAEILKTLPEDTLQSFAKFLEKNPSFAEKLAGLPQDELQDLFDEIMDQLSADSNVMTPTAMRKALGQVKGQLTDEQLKNLEELRKIQDPEVFQNFLELLKNNPDSVSKFLEGKVEPNMPLADLVKLVESLNDKELNNLVSLSKSLNPQQLKEVLSLDSEQDEQPRCQVLLQNDKFNPDVIEKILEVKEALSEAQFDQLLKLNSELSSEDFQQMLQLKDSNPEDLYILLTADQNGKRNKQLAAEAIEKLNNLSKEQPETVLHLAQLLDNVDTKCIETLAELSNKNEFPALVKNTSAVPASVPILAKIPEILGEDAMDKLGKILTENPEVFQQLVNSGPAESKKALGSKSSLRSIPRRSAIPGDSDEDVINEWDELIDEDSVEGPSGNKKLSSLVKFSDEFQNVARKLEEAENKFSEANKEKEKLWGVVRELQEAKSALEQDVKALAEAEEKVRDQLEDANCRNSVLEDEILGLKEAIEEGKKLDERKLQEVGKELDKLQSENEALKGDLKEQQMIKDENQKLRERLHTFQEEMKHDNLKRQLDKLYWVNRELIAQIRERDIQTDKLKEDFKELQHEDRLKDQQIVELDAKKREQKDLVAKRELEETIKRQESEAEECKAEMWRMKNEIAGLNKKLDLKNSELSQQKQTNSDDVKAKENEFNDLKKQIQALKEELKKKDAKLVEEKTKMVALKAQQEKMQEEIREMNRQLKLELTEIDDASSKLKMSLKAKEFEQDDLKRSLQEKEEEIESLKKKMQNLEEYMDADFSETYSLTNRELDDNPPATRNEATDKYKVPPGTIFPLTSWNDKPNFATDYVNPTKLNRYDIDSNLSDSRLKGSNEKPAESKPSSNGVTKTGKDTNKYSSAHSSVPSSKQNTGVKSSPNTGTYGPSLKYPSVNKSDPTKSDRKSKSRVVPNSLSFPNGLSSSKR